MFVPLHDINPLRTVRAPIVTYAIISACTLSYIFLQSGLFIDAEQESAAAFGFIPAEFRLGIGLRGPAAIIPEPLTFLTYTFVHGGWMHLIGNMLFLWVFGDNVEDSMGHVRFMLFYALSGTAAALAHAAATPVSDVPLVGASGAVAGVIGAYVMLHPKVKLWVLLFMRIPIKITAAWAIAGWLLAQVFSVMTAASHEIAWWAHIGGFAAGALLVTVMRRRGVPLFDRGLVVVPATAVGIPPRGEGR